ncbi:hypothetical protein LXL04_028730 [Taraxacum kok-saghyz]
MLKNDDALTKHRLRGVVSYRRSATVQQRCVYISCYNTEIKGVYTFLPLDAYAFLPLYAGLNKLESFDTESCKVQVNRLISKLRLSTPLNHVYRGVGLVEFQFYSKLEIWFKALNSKTLYRTFEIRMKILSRLCGVEFV